MRSVTRTLSGRPWSAPWISPKPDQVLAPLLASPASGWPQLQDRHPAAPAASISQVVDLLVQANGLAAPPGEPALPRETLTRSEVRVLRYLPTNLSTREVRRRALPIDEHGQDPSAAPATRSSARAAAPRPSSRPAPSACLAPAHRVARGPG